MRTIHFYDHGAFFDNKLFLIGHLLGHCHADTGYMTESQTPSKWRQDVAVQERDASDVIERERLQAHYSGTFRNATMSLESNSHERN